MPAGRPTEFQPDFVDQARKLCLLGATDAQLADFFEVSETTINNWKNQFPEFLESVKSGKKIADAQVASSLFGRATGAEWTEDTAIKVKKVTYTENGKRSAEVEEVVTVPVRCSAPPDTTACIFWLKNRKADEWRDRAELKVLGDPLAELLAEFRREYETPPKPVAPDAAT